MLLHLLAVGDVVAQALDAGFTCIQVRSKVASAREIIALTGDAAQPFLFMECN